MTASNFNASLTEVLKSEGGYVNNPRDPGGATNMGITRAALERWRGHPVSVNEVKNLTRDEAAKIYHADYWNAVQGDDLPTGLDYAVFDFAVNSGKLRAIKFLQGVLRVKVDGKIGPETIAAVRKVEPVAAIAQLCGKRLSWLKTLKTWATFGKGWEKRVNHVRATAAQMARQAVPPPDVPIPTPRPETAPTGFLGRLIAFLMQLLKGLKK